jgi:hypothetical protein
VVARKQAADTATCQGPPQLRRNEERDDTCRRRHLERSLDEQRCEIHLRREPDAGP